MLFPELLQQELLRQARGFADFDRRLRTEVDYYVRALLALDAATLGPAPAECAWPADEFARAGSFAVRFNETWPTHEAARRWALEILHDRVTCAADGSQLVPGREVSLPVALVQVAWFENAHTEAGNYRKEARANVISPAELMRPTDGRVNPETVVSYRRFQLETEALCEFIERQRGWRRRGERLPVAFFDGSFTFMLAFGGARAELQGQYEHAIARLLALSREAETPVVGYIDQSYARDLVNMLDALRGDAGAQERFPGDAQILPPLLQNWGDRTVFCHYRHAGLDAKLKGEEVGFTYLNTSADAAPARLELPAWTYRAGLLDEIVDTVRAECVCGLGYPYAIESADQAAVITLRDREIFLRAVQEFAAQGGFSFRVSRKTASKMRRR
jgi:hypothetical protein